MRTSWATNNARHLLKAVKCVRSFRKIPYTGRVKRIQFPYIAWLVSVVSVAGSFFFSNFMKLPPCTLCWYQRIFMFPLVIVLGVGFIFREPKNHYYSLPLIGIGWLIAFYHNLIYYKMMRTTSWCNGEDLQDGRLQ
ncbi:MAG: disulfide bond formation protein B [Sphingobacteriales bacterium]|nr:MAG: disulfide bond formation protein B [Sphingobacteriales bacterium]